jgi:hypothetical protein
MGVEVLVGGNVMGTGPAATEAAACAAAAANADVANLGLCRAGGAEMVVADFDDASPLAKPGGAGTGTRPAELVACEGIAMTTSGTGVGWLAAAV